MITIAMAADRGFAMQLAVTMASLRATQGEAIHVYVLHDRIDQDLRRQVERGASPAQVTWLQVETDRIDGIALPTYLTQASLFRLLLPSMLPDDVDRLVYLDADVLVRAPLDDLWGIDLDGAPVAAVRDAVVPWAGSPGALPWRELGLEPRSPYFNAGVLLVDLDAWREEDVTGRALRGMNGARFRHGDQCGLNNALAGGIQQLDATWNLQAGHLLADASSAWLVEETAVLERAIADPAVVHFNTSILGRPWESSCSHPFRDAWFETLSTTSWAGWQPSLGRELLDHLTAGGLPQRLVRRLQVAGQALLHGE
jgi:lipopolysaccharide biosynthesis glycosyltransferase